MFEIVTPEFLSFACCVPCRFYGIWRLWVQYHASPVLKPFCYENMHKWLIFEFFDPLRHREGTIMSFAPKTNVTSLKIREKHEKIA